MAPPDADEVPDIPQDVKLLKLELFTKRESYTLSCDRLADELEKDVPDIYNVDSLMKMLERKAAVLAEVDTRYMAQLYQRAPADELLAAEVISNEYKNSEAFQDRLSLMRVLTDAVLEKHKKKDSNADYQSVRSVADVDPIPMYRSRRGFRLPEIVWKKFSGDPKDWLGFWAPDKFQYLLQAVEKGSRAGLLVNSFPLSAECYPKAIASLKSRFGREDILVEVYVRELLRLVLHNAQKNEQKIVLSSLYDKLETYLRALESLGVASEKYAAMLYPLVESCLPEKVMWEWERDRSRQCAKTDTNSEDRASETPCPLTMLMAFLRGEVERQERITMAKEGFSLQENEEKVNKTKPRAENKSGNVPTAAGLFSGSQTTQVNKSVCIFCDGNFHESRDCFKGMKMSHGQKRDLVTKKKCCLCCFKTGHLIKDCKSRIQCPVCSKKHFAIMCPELPTRNSDSDDKKSDSTVKKDVCAMTSQTCTDEVLLQTLLVKLRNGKKEIVVRALVDGGAQHSYISEKSAKALGYQCVGKQTIVHSLFGGLQTKKRVHSKYLINVSSLDGNYHCQFHTLDEKKICGKIPRTKNGPWLEEIKKFGIILSDLGNDCPDIDLLIGADVEGKLRTTGLKQLKCGPVAVETKLGWTLIGKTENSGERSDSTLLVHSLFVSDADIQTLWKLDTIGITDPIETQTRADMEKSAMDHFKNTVTRHADGRYEVVLPWISDHKPLDSNRHIAERRLHTTTKKLTSENLMGTYQNIFNLWLREGIVEEVPGGEKVEEVHYLPHSAVLKPNSATTPVRPVFDAFSHGKMSPSLNTCLEKGPNFLELIPSILIRFWLGAEGIVSDIEKAFLQIAVRLKDCDYLRFLWWEDTATEETPEGSLPLEPKLCSPSSKEREIKEFRHRRVVFGVTSSPFLLSAVINFHLDQAPDILQETAQKLKAAFYVDNCVVSVSSAEDREKFIKESTQMMSTAKFNLRNWVWNSKENNTETVIPVLGLSWDLKSDTLSCDLRNFSDETSNLVTKRKILSVIHRVFDPIGFSCPVTLVPKVLLQKTWVLNLGWDDELPEEIASEFKKWFQCIHDLAETKIPRWCFSASCGQEYWSLHVFVDASKSAYAACVFMRADTADGVSVQLLLAKSRVAPVKAPTIPRLELMACCIGARLADSVKKTIGLPEIPTHYWSDSANALWWIRKDDQWGTFVGNRVKEIRQLSDYSCWKHVPGLQNPADLPTKGCSAKRLKELSWWEGPSWLKKSEEFWPKSTCVPDMDVVNAEKRKIVASHLTLDGQDQFSSRFLVKTGDYNNVLRLVATVKRFIDNCRVKSGAKKRKNTLSADEIDRAEIILLKLVQKEALAVDSDLFRSVTVSEDSDGSLRLKTKITRRNDKKDFRLPFALPPQHSVVKCLILAKHHELCHAGTQMLHCALRERFWVLPSRKTIKEVIQSCVRCRKFDAKHLETVPPPLPLDRVKDAAVFEVTGVDFAGPLFLKRGKKAWIVLFTCAVYRAVHLELVCSLSTDSFLQAFRRFISRRGRPSIVYSDNGTNFVGAVNLLKGLDWNVIERQASIHRIKWKFIVPSSPWWGGWWERIVRMVKRILRRVLGRASLQYEEMLTILCDCESVLNGRPLTYVSEDSEDLITLTPAMFIQDVKEVGVLDLDLADGQHLNKRLMYRQRLREDLRARFRLEYLGLLVQPKPATKVSRSIVPGEVVLVGNDQSKRIDWNLARVLEVFPGEDGQVRVARLKTTKGEVTRPVQRLYPLEVNPEDRESFVSTAPKVTSATKNSKIKVQVPHLEAEVSTQPEPQIVTRSGRKIKKPERFGQ